MGREGKRRTRVDKRPFRRLAAWKRTPTAICINCFAFAGEPYARRTTLTRMTPVCLLLMVIERPLVNARNDRAEKKPRWKGKRLLKGISPKLFRHFRVRRLLGGSKDLQPSSSMLASVFQSGIAGIFFLFDFQERGVNILIQVPRCLKIVL